MPLTWQDTGELARVLASRHPDSDPLKATLPDIRRMIVELPDFEDDPDAASDQDLEEIQSVWYDIYQE